MEIVDLNSFSRSSFKSVVSNFSCFEHPELISYLKQFAYTHHQDGLFQTYLLQENNEYKAYISFVMTEITEDNDSVRSQLNVSITNHYPIPALKITRLCVSDNFLKQGIGTILLEFAKILAYDQQIKVGCRAILVDSKISAIGFYKYCGYIELEDIDIDGNEPLPMFFPIESLGGSHQIKNSPEKQEMLNLFITFSEKFGLNHFAETFKRLLKSH